jgi:hypothetical protein
MKLARCLKPVRPLARVVATGAVLSLLQVASPVVMQEIGYQGNLPGQAMAAEKTKNTEKTRKTPALSAKVYEQLEKAQEYAEAEQFKEALAVLDKLKGRSSKFNPYELAQM